MAIAANSWSNMQGLSGALQDVGQTASCALLYHHSSHSSGRHLDVEEISDLPDADLLMSVTQRLDLVGKVLDLVHSFNVGRPARGPASVFCVL